MRTIYICVIILTGWTGGSFPSELNEVNKSPWAGVYVYTETGMNAEGTRSFSSTYCIEVFKENDKLLAHKYEFENGGMPWNYEIWTVEINSGTMIFRYNKTCDTDNPQKCVLAHKSGEYILALEKTASGKRAAYKPTWFKLQPFNYEENRDSLYFIKEEINCREGG